MIQKKKSIYVNFKSLPSNNTITNSLTKKETAVQYLRVVKGNNMTTILETFKIFTL